MQGGHTLKSHCLQALVFPVVAPEGPGVVSRRERPVWLKFHVSVLTWLGSGEHILIEDGESQALLPWQLSAMVTMMVAFD